MNIFKPGILIAAFILTAAASQAQAGADTLVAYNHNGKWGFIGRHSTDVTFVIAPAYEMAYPFYDGRAAVRKDNLWGFIDGSGKLVIPYQFSMIKNYRFNQGLAAVKKGESYAVIDVSGKTILPFTFTDASLYPKQQVIVTTSNDAKNPNNIYGLKAMYDYRGKQLLKTEYEYIDPFSDNKAVCVTKANKRSLVDTKGIPVSKNWYESLTFSDIPHYIASNPKQNDLYTNDGKLIFSAAYDYVGSLNDDRAMFKGENKKIGYLDAKGNVAIEAKYDWGENFSEGKAITQHRGGVDVIDTKGNILGTVPGGDLSYKFKNSVAWIRQAPPSFKYYAYGTDLQKIFPQGYDEVSSFDENGLAVVKVDKKRGLIDKKGNIVLPFEYTHISNGFKGQYIITTADNAEGIATANGKILFAPQKIDIYPYDDDFYRIRPGGFYMEDNGEYFCMYRKDGVYYYDQNKQ